jgi:hypothetical protein
MTCDRLERDDLLGHLGEEMDPHVEQCHVCRATAYGYARLTAALRQQSPRALPTAWKERTVARIHAERAARRRRRAASVGLSLASAAALILILAPRGGDPPDLPRQLSVRVERSGGWRGASGPSRATRGALLRVSSPGPGDHAELRLYRGASALVVRCPGDAPPACRRRGDTLEMERALDVVGEYHAIWLESSSPLPQPSGHLDADVIAAERAGARVIDDEAIHVH